MDTSPDPLPDPLVDLQLSQPSQPTKASLPDPSVPRQLIIATDRRNPSITLYRMSDLLGLKVLQVYYGVELLEEVADDVADPTFRCMVARLYNAGLKLKTLVEVFSLDPKTIRSWGEALKSRDPKRLTILFFGADAGRKRTALISKYVRMRLPELVLQGVRSYRVTLIEEIEKLYDTRISGETLRVIMRDIDAVKSVELPLLPAEPDSEQTPLLASAACPGCSGADIGHDSTGDIEPPNEAHDEAPLSIESASPGTGMSLGSEVVPLIPTSQVPLAEASNPRKDTPFF